MSASCRCRSSSSFSLAERFSRSSCLRSSSAALRLASSASRSLRCFSCSASWVASASSAFARACSASWTAFSSCSLRVRRASSSAARWRSAFCASSRARASLSRIASPWARRCCSAICLAISSGLSFFSPVFFALARGFFAAASLLFFSAVAGFFAAPAGVFRLSFFSPPFFAAMCLVSATFCAGVSVSSSFSTAMPASFSRESRRLTVIFSCLASAATVCSATAISNSPHSSTKPWFARFQYQRRCLFFVQSGVGHQFVHRQLCQVFLGVQAVFLQGGDGRFVNAFDVFQR